MLLLRKWSAEWLKLILVCTGSCANCKNRWHVLQVHLPVTFMLNDGLSFGLA